MRERNEINCLYRRKKCNDCFGCQANSWWMHTYKKTFFPPFHLYRIYLVIIVIFVSVRTMRLVIQHVSFTQRRYNANTDFPHWPIVFHQICFHWGVLTSTFTRFSMCPRSMLCKQVFSPFLYLYVHILVADVCLVLSWYSQLRQLQTWTHRSARMRKTFLYSFQLNCKNLYQLFFPYRSGCWFYYLISSSGVNDTMSLKMIWISSGGLNNKFWNYNNKYSFYLYFKLSLNEPATRFTVRFMCQCLKTTIVFEIFNKFKEGLTLYSSLTPKGWFHSLFCRMI